MTRGETWKGSELLSAMSSHKEKKTHLYRTYMPPPRRLPSQNTGGNRDCEVWRSRGRVAGSEVVGKRPASACPELDAAEPSVTLPRQAVKSSFVQALSSVYVQM